MKPVTRCWYCEHPLHNAPTDRPWVGNRAKAICFECIKRLNEVREAILKLPKGASGD